MFYLVDRVAGLIVGSRESIDGITEFASGEVQRGYKPEELEIAETLLAIGDNSTTVAKKIPPELDRAVEAWNRMCERLPVKLAKVKSAARYLPSYRRWKRENRERNYLLEKLVDDVQRQSWTHAWIEFGWLFGKKQGTPNAEKLRNGKFDGARRNDARTPGDDDFKPTER